MAKGLKTKGEGSKPGKKRLTIILAVILIGLFSAKGYLVYSSNHKQTQKTAAPISKLSSTNANAGCMIVGAALKEYQQAHGSYPAKLSELYPDYVKERGVIDYSGWKYRTEGSDYFCLERTAEYHGVKYLYRIDTSFKVTKTVMEDKNAGSLLARLGKKIKSITGSATEPDEAIAVNTDEIDLSVVAQGVLKAKQAEDRAEMEEKLRSAPAETETKVELQASTYYVKSDDSAVPDDIFAISEALRDSSFLIWVDKNENLCFSNVQYAHINKVKAICAARDWLIPDLGEEVANNR